MAALLCRSAGGTRGVLLKLRTATAAAASVRVYTNRLESVPSSVLQQACQKGKDPPRVSPLELMYRLTFQGFYSRMHELQIFEKKRYGPIYRDGMNSVSVNTASLLEEVLRNENKFPNRGDMSLWREYREIRGYGYGPFTVEGEKWRNLRKVLNQRMLHPKDSAAYADTLNEIVTDFIKRIYYLRQCSPTGDMVTDVANEFYSFSLEAIASILLETRLGCLEKEIPPGTREFIDSISRMFSNLFYALLMPKWSRSLLPYWKRFVAGWDGIFNFAIVLIDKKMELIQQRLEDNCNVEGEYLTYLLSSTQMDIRDVYGSVAELLLAGVDTTSNTLTWTLHLLATNPECQDRLHEELHSVIPGDKIPSAAEVTRIPYLRAVIKESLRMYPVVSMNGRVFLDRDVTIGGYKFPKNTTFALANYAIGHDEDTFPEPDKFLPERWLRGRGVKANAFGSIPFGFGVRSCVGRRIAELEMYLALFRLIKHFEIKPDPTIGELKSVTRTVLVPDKPLNLHFVDRQA
ncbi:sterol 26-hydroxylase, mitochondrial-like [Nelusetta ayraudi]|uniref:sterol 26-hydroxylase, mitochondrial-like n=1 Tax=Nelusetta ayraudi TaxID=303726 RepID=UPI003F711106